MDYITADYFGHGYYALYRDTLLPRQQTEAECAFILKIIRPKKGWRWLDLPCAYGRHLFSLAGLEPKLQLHGADINLAYMSEPGLQDCATRTLGAYGFPSEKRSAICCRYMTIRFVLQ